MPGEEITAQVKQFIRETINSVEQLEVLLFVVSNPEREWSAAEVSSRIRAPEESVAAKLAGLQQVGLVAVRQADIALYRYLPGSSALAQEVADSLKQAYEEGRESLIQLIYSRPMDNIRYFADAFRIRRKEDE